MLSRKNILFIIPGLIIKGNKIDFAESAANLGIVFNDRLSWSNHINVCWQNKQYASKFMGIYIDSTSFAILIQIAKTYVIPVLFYVRTTTHKIKILLCYVNYNK